MASCSVACSRAKPIGCRHGTRCCCAYRRLEAQGHIRGGRFVAGMSGEQFALPDAVGALRATRRKPPDEAGFIERRGSSAISAASSRRVHACRRWRESRAAARRRAAAVLAGGQTGLSCHARTSGRVGGEKCPVAESRADCDDASELTCCGGLHEEPEGGRAGAASSYVPIA